MSGPAKFNLLAAILAALLWPGTAGADERVALLFVQRNYDTLPDVPEAARLLSLVAVLRDEGFDVRTFTDLDSSKLRLARTALVGLSDQADRLLIIAAGHIGSTRQDAFLYSGDAPRPHLLSQGDEALSLGGLLQMIEGHAGSAVLLVGEALASMNAGAGIAQGFGTQPIPQGVTVFTGPANDLVSLVADGLLIEGQSIAQTAASASKNIRALGFLPAGVAFLPVSADIGDATSGELEAFSRAQATGSAEAFEDFLRAYPDGDYADAARSILADLAPSPEELAQQGEAELGLSRSRRTKIQGDLTYLGFDTNGVDGIFGRGTRTAITNWQRANDLDATGYLDSPAIDAIAAQAQKKRNQEDEADIAYWRQSGRDGTKDGYRKYLDRYPQGLFADIAEKNLAELEAASGASERAAWKDANDADTEQAYRAYLGAYPDGRHAADAVTRLQEIEASEDRVAKARGEEAQVMSSPLTRLLAERRLEQLGFEPGLVDGTFGPKTRQAIRKYQRDKNLFVSGFIDRKTFARLLSTGN